MNVCWNSLSRFFPFSYLTGGSMAAERNPALAAVLDETTGNGLYDATNEQGNDTNAYYEEHMARLKAEAEAEDKTNRLRVAQEQLAEYAAEKCDAATSVLQQAEAVNAALQALLGGVQGNSAATAGEAAALATQLEGLKARLSEMAAEAQAFAEQQRADVERLKRSSAQAELVAADEDVEMKRARETEAPSSSSSSTEMEDGESDGEEDGSSDAAARAGLCSSSGRVSNGGDAAELLGAASSFRERCKYIPLRLTMSQRRLLRLLEAALHVSEYTDKVDVLTWRSKTQRVHTQIRDLCAILSGLVVAQDYKRGQQLVADRDFKENADFFQEVFEIGRRHKVMNPEKMRSEYGKLIYMLMDSTDKNVQELLEFKCVCPLVTVASVLEQHGASALLDEPSLALATAEVVAGDRPRHEVQRDIKLKERAREGLARKYRRAGLSEEDILWCLYSISDNNAFLLFNRDPIDRMLTYFRSYFRPEAIDGDYSLAISGGRGGARLTHSHEKQYHYVLQSLTLWREIMTDMFKLWYLAESDMLRESNSYRLCDTGQGLNRVQGAPQVSRAMSGILARCQRAIGGWVGSSVVHLGDHNVPNALMFIDKYTQVPRILNPVVLVLDELPRLVRDRNLAQYVQQTFGGVEECRKYILTDFCRHAFDGSGADNFFDAGSCIDGRLTSAWNWCSKIEKKPYYHIFKVAGFVGFDGDFQK